METSKFIICNNTHFLVFNTQLLVVDTKFLVFNTKFMILLTVLKPQPWETTSTARFTHALARALIHCSGSTSLGAKVLAGGTEILSAREPSTPMPQASNVPILKWPMAPISSAIQSSCAAVGFGGVAIGGAGGGGGGAGQAPALGLPLQNSSFYMQSSSFLIHNSSFLLHISSF